ncbi:hypothetical protein CEXT_248301 [Caerostris extrusa]|uniref:Uncharacterized protein n=1 Tax=Caerostris extrusa TaxID=172846 RepID=A0AAV4XKD6_CAEEX|nr:hypothetical protein CEXT_248301 [Caerostris extrusa]
MNKIQNLLGDCVPHNASPNKELQTSETANLKACEDLFRRGAISFLDHRNQDESIRDNRRIPDDIYLPSSTNRDLSPSNNQMYPTRGTLSRSTSSKSGASGGFVKVGSCPPTPNSSLIFPPHNQFRNTSDDTNDFQVQ